MAEFLNKGKGAYLEAKKDKVFVDKTEMLCYLNSVARTKHKYVCVSRPRRFGKTYAADMICAYYGRGADSRDLFQSLKISATDPVTVDDERLEWDHYLGAFDVVRVTVTDFIDSQTGVQEGVADLVEEVSSELKEAYPNVRYGRRTKLWSVMSKIHVQTGRSFVIVIDEWDAPMRMETVDEEGQRVYLDFLRDWLKDKDYIALAYMTGILPIKKYGNDSALNMFDEFTMTDPGALAEYVGFTDGEVRQICDARGLRFEAMREWYDGYRLSNVPSEELVMDQSPGKVFHVYNPLSVTSAAGKKQLKGYWGESNTFNALAEYVRMDFQGLKRKVALMMEGAHVPTDIGGYQNDMSSFASADDVVAMLIHRGYLGWDEEAKEAFIPNREVMGLFGRSTEGPAWELEFQKLRESRELIALTLEGDERAVAAAHDEVDNKHYH